MAEGRPYRCNRIRGACPALGIVLGIVLGMTGCIPGSLLYRDMETAAPGGRERKLLLEELELWIREESDEPEESAQEPQEDEEVLQEGSFLQRTDSPYAYSTLNGEERLWYRDMAVAMGTMTDRVKLSEQGITAGLDEGDVDRIFQSVLCDHPELFYVEGYSYTKYTRGTDTVAIEFTGTYSMDWDTAKERWEEIDREVNLLIQAAPKTDDDYEKIKYVYETLILQTDYDPQAEDNQNIYSVFVGHASVCQGYAKAFQYLMNRMGAECALVQGRVRDTGEGHAWNLVRSNGDYYYVDTTWGDISYRSADRQETEEGLPQISYDYLCITTDQLLRTHIPDAAMPECIADADNYYVRENALFTDYDRELLARLVERRLAEGNTAISFRCADGECFRSMSEALVDRQEIFDYLGGTGINSFVYTSNDRQYTLTFFMVTSTG